ncbi:MAG: hypothetical protein MI743_16650, partial [Sneathiellales bacterium]|nr:hypothetical protein [Sneathiellales bacterium]
MASRKFTYRLACWALALIGSFSAFIALAADKVAIRAGEHPSYGRLVIDWGKQQSFDAKIEKGALVIRFPESFEADLSVGPRILDGYLKKGSFIDGNKGVRYPLKGEFTLKTARYGTAIAFDLKKKAALSTNGSLSKNDGKKSTGPKIRVRAGDHSDFSRLVFDWNSRTAFQLKQDGDQVTVTFGKSGDLQLDRIKRDLPKFVEKIDTVQKDGSTEVTLTLKPDVGAKAFRSGNSIALDLKAGAKPTSRPASKPQVVANNQRSEEKTVQNPVRKITPAKSVVKTEPAQPKQLVQQASEPEQVEKQKPRSLLPQTGPKKTVQKSTIAPPAEKLVIEVGKLKDGFRLIFPWKESAAMALFQRGDLYWLVFDKRVRLDFKNVSGPVKLMLVRKKQLPHDTATVASLFLREGYAPTVARTDNEWRVDFRLGEAPVIKNTVDIQPQPASTEGARVFIPAVNNGNRVAFIDPQAGDEMIAVPLYSPSWGIGSTRTFAQFTVLPSMQGIGLLPRDNAVNVAVERNGVSITAKGGLQLTRNISKDDLFASGDQTDRFSGNRDKARLVKLEEWAEVPPKEFWERKQKLQRKVAKAPRTGRNGARLKLAKFLVAHKFYPDAFAVLERIRIDDPRADDDGVYRLVRGLPSLGMNHLEDAEKDLFHPVFSGVAEVAPWRAMVAAGKEDWKTASREIKAGRDAYGVYSTDLQNEFRLLEAEAALEEFDIEAANNAIEGIRTSLSEGADPYVAARREYLEGLSALRSGDMERAISKFDQAIALDIRPVVAKAKYAKINAELAQKDITPEEAIEQFQKMEFAWRGDDLEVEIQKRVGDLH